MKTLRWRLTLGVTAVVFAALLAFAGRFYQVTLEWTQKDTLEAAGDKTVRVGRELGAKGTLPAESPEVHVAILGPDGRLDRRRTSHSFPEGDFDVPEVYRTNTVPWADPHAREVQTEDGRRFAVAWYPLGEPGSPPVPVPGWTAVAIPVRKQDARAEELRGQLVVRILGITFSSGLLVYLLTGLWTRSLASAADSAEQLAEGDLTLRQLAAPKADSELRRLVLAFNALLDRLRKLHTSQQRFIADAAHELRTPLTILRGEIQVALRKDREADRYRAVLQSNLEEVVRLSRMIENLLALARADSGTPLGRPEIVPAQSLCRGVIEKLGGAAHRARVRLRTEVPDGAAFHGDAVALERVIFNLVENAIRYSSPDDDVLIRITPNGARLRLEVSDHGPGITPEHLPQVFGRFYRVDSARNRSDGGAGLGLAIVKSLVEAQGGTVEVQSEVGVGTTFSVSLPHP